MMTVICRAGLEYIHELESAVRRYILYSRIINKHNRLYRKSIHIVCARDSGLLEDSKSLIKRMVYLTLVTVSMNVNRAGLNTMPPSIVM